MLQAIVTSPVPVGFQPSISSLDPGGSNWLSVGLVAPPSTLTLCGTGAEL